MEVSPVVVVPKNLNVTQPMAAVAKPAPVVEAPKPVKEPFAPAITMPPVAHAREAPPASVLPTVAKESPSKENGHSKDNGLTKDRILAKGSPTLVEFAQTPKPVADRLHVEPAPANGNKSPSPMAWQNGLAKSEAKPEETKPEETKNGHAVEAKKVAADEVVTREFVTREAVTRVSRPEDDKRPESKRGVDSKRDPGGSGRHSQVSGEIDERFFEEGTRSERELMAGRHQVESDAGLELESLDEKAAYKMRPEVQARRARNARVVAWVVGAFMVLLVAGLAKHRMARGEQDVGKGGSAAAEITAAPGEEKAAAQAPAAQQVEGVAAPAAPDLAAQAAVPPSAPAPADPVKPAAGEVKADEAKGEAKADQKAGDTPAASAPAAAAVSESGKTAAQEKHDCQVALERSSWAPPTSRWATGPRRAALSTPA